MKPDAPPSQPSQPVSATRSPALSNRELSTPPSPAGPPAAPAAPTSRPKLNLAKRTVSEAPSDAVSSPVTSDSKSSPFGAAKPKDTASREKEIEEKRQIAIREKKEADEKARVEKKAADEKAREEKRLAKEAEIAARNEARNEKKAANEEKPNGQTTPREKPSFHSPKEKENGSAGPPPGKNYEILRRTANEDASLADEEADEADVNGLSVDDKAIKPKEITRDISTKNEEATKTNGAPTSTDPSAEALENDGWSTVSKPQKNRNKSGNQAARAIAS